MFKFHVAKIGILFEYTKYLDIFFSIIFFQHKKQRKIGVISLCKDNKNIDMNILKNINKQKKITTEILTFKTWIIQ